MNYLYNGVELPDIEEVWTDKETYPYAYIMRSPYVDGSFYFEISKIEAYATPPAGRPRFSKNENGLVGYLDYGDESWTVMGEVPLGLKGYFTANLIWANHDVCDEDGDIVWPTSNPTPVSTLDPTALLMGYRVGQLIGGIRKNKEEV